MFAFIGGYLVSKIPPLLLGRGSAAKCRDVQSSHHAATYDPSVLENTVPVMFGNILPFTATVGMKNIFRSLLSKHSALPK